MVGEGTNKPGLGDEGHGPNLMGAFNYFDHDDGVSDIDGVVIIVVVVVVIVKVEPLGCWIIS
jgi:hypothetical protein